MTVNTDNRLRPLGWVIKTGKMTKEQLVAALERAGVVIGDAARAAINAYDFKVDFIERHVSLVRVTPKQLGLRDLARADEVCAAAKHHQLALCTPDIGLWLRLRYIDQPAKEWLRIGMRPLVANNRGDERYIDIGRDRGTPSLYLSDSHNGGWRTVSGYVFETPNAQA